MTLTVGIFVFDGFEALDVAGPFEVFSTAGRLTTRQGQPPAFKPIMLSQFSQSVSGRGAFRVVPHGTIEHHPPLDVLILPGGTVDDANDEQVLDWVRAQQEGVQLTASVCTGAFILGWAGLLPELATTHFEDQELLAASFPGTRISQQRFVDAGRVITSGGISAGIDMSLHLVERLHSRELAEQTARQMEYEWKRQPPEAPPGDVGY